MFFSKKLKNFKNIKHCFFSRKNGFSSGIYRSLNCGAGSFDKKENILKNIKYVSKKIGCKTNSLITLNQVHSNKVIFFKKVNDIKNKLSGDAIVTKIRNIGIGVLAADCVPILLYDPKKKIIGCIHSGWKGAFNGIIKNTIKNFKKLNSNMNDLIAVIGPCIGKKSYNVKLDFYNKFIEKNHKNKKFFHKIDKNTELYVRFEATNPQSSNINQHNSVKSQNSQGSSDSWVGASVNS